ncbi:MAG TPA: GntR family transcriptional regulator [Steroidobacteraceae bacterium]|nr:GntR family transcriptional regulator [Steroidobacteraceae bacterium]
MATGKRRKGGHGLQARLASRILEHARTRTLSAGEWLSENALAQEFAVSRTPVRGALRILAKDGLVASVPRRGYVLKRTVRDTDLHLYDVGDSSEDRLAERMAADRLTGELPGQVSEADLMRRYDVPRTLLARVLHRMAQDGILERRDSQGWRFLPTLDSAQLHDESYRFRLLIEPAGLLEPTFAVDHADADRIRLAHEQMLESDFRNVSSVAFFDLNAAFHEFVARCSGNRFFLQAVVQQNRLRRFFSYHWVYGQERMRESCREHLAILAKLAAGEREQAATLLRLHLLDASAVRPQFNKTTGLLSHRKTR